MEEDLITVIVPVYNVEKYLRTCLESVICQTYRNLEIILVDDGSTDSCPSICDEYAVRDARLKVLHKKNGGLSDARNAGIEAASGSYITFVDSDDFIFPAMMETLHRLCREEAAEISVCRYLRCMEKDTEKDVKQPAIKEKVQIFNGKEKMEAFLVAKQIDTVAWNKMYAARLFKTLRFPKGRVHEDVFTMCFLIHDSCRIAVTNYCGYVYRRSLNSITNSEFSKKKLDVVTAKKVQLKFIERNYPYLRSYAAEELIYVCNVCLREMELKGYENRRVEAEFKDLYRKYAKYYIRRRDFGIKGKIVAALACLHVKLARKCIRIVIGVGKKI